MKSILHIVIIIYCLLITNITKAQSFILYGDKTFGGNEGDLEAMMRQGANNRFFILGVSHTNISGDKTDPLCNPTASPPHNNNWLVMTDTAFNIIWDKNKGGDVNELEPYLSTILFNNKIIFSCWSTSDSACDKSQHRRNVGGDYWIEMADSNGNKLWDKTLGGLNSPSKYPKIIQLTTGEIIVAGLTFPDQTGDQTVFGIGGNDYWVVKLDTLGNKIWDKVYGGLSNELQDFTLLADKSGGFIIAGTTNSPISGNISQAPKGMWDTWVIKLNSAGTKIWDQRYGGSAGSQVRPTHVINTDDNGFILCAFLNNATQGGDISDPPIGGNVFYNDCWVLKLDSLGNKQWDKRYGGNKDDYANWIEQAPGGGYWVSGGTSSDIGFDVSEAPYNTTNADYWIFKIDSLGNKLFDRRFGPNITVINNGTRSNNFIIMPDSSIYLCGSSPTGTSAVKADSGKGIIDYWVVHFKYGYNTSVGLDEIANFSNSVSVFPNPTKDIVTIKSTTEKIKKIELFNIFGEIIYTQKENNVNTAQVNLQNQPPGFYFVKITGERNTVAKKVTKN